MNHVTVTGQQAGRYLLLASVRAHCWKTYCRHPRGQESQENGRWWIVWLVQNLQNVDNFNRSVFINNFYLNKRQRFTCKFNHPQDKGDSHTGCLLTL